MVILDFEKFRTSKAVPVFAGWVRGKKCREVFALARLDDSDDQVEVRIPGDILCMNVEFFEACFRESIRKLGRFGFLAKYTFVCPNRLRERISYCIDDILKRSHQPNPPIVITDHL